jgi:hypothetical protein
VSRTSIEESERRFDLEVMGGASAAAVTRSRSESITLPCLSFSCPNQGEARLPPGEVSLFCALEEGFIRENLAVQ